MLSYQSSRRSCGQGGGSLATAVPAKQRERLCPRGWYLGVGQGHGVEARGALQLDEPVSVKGRLVHRLGVKNNRVAVVRVRNKHHVHGLALVLGRCGLFFSKCYAW